MNEGSHFTDQVLAAINTVRAANAGWFDDVAPCGAGWHVVDAYHGAYVQAVAAETATRSVCAIQDPNDGNEIAVKFNNDFADNYQLVSSAGCARRPPMCYTSTCRPAWF